MYVRSARSRDEPWLLEQIESMDLSRPAFTPEEFVIAVNEDTDNRVGFGRLRIHAESETAELTCLGVKPAWREQGVGAHLVERLLTIAGDDSFETVYVVTDQPSYFSQFGFAACETVPDPLAERLDSETTLLSIAPTAFSMPSRLREAFKAAEPAAGNESEEPTETAADFGIDADSATYKYDTGS